VLGFLEASGDVLSINKPPPDTPEAALSINKPHTQELSLLHLKALGSTDGAITAQPGSYIALDHSTNTLSLTSGGPVTKAAFVTEVADLVAHVRIL
jgi:hypothetical protein